MESLLDYAPLPDQIRPGNKVVLSAAGGWAAPTTGQQQPGDLDAEQTCDFF